MFFAIYKIIGTFVVPPGIFVILILVAALWALKRPKKPMLSFFLCMLALGLYFISLPIAARITLKPLEMSIQPSLPQETAIIVVLGGGQRRTKDLLEADVSPHTLVRLIGGLELAIQFDWPVIFCGGSYSKEVPEALTMAKRARRLFPNLTIYEESQSRTTWENLKNVSPLLKSLKLNDAVIVTHGYHMPRALMTAKKMVPEINWHPYPVGKMTDVAPLSLIDFLPNASDLHVNSLALREYLGIVAYKIKLLLSWT